MDREFFNWPWLPSKSWALETKLIWTTTNEKLISRRRVDINYCVNKHPKLPFKLGVSLLRFNLQGNLKTTQFNFSFSQRYLILQLFLWLEGRNGSQRHITSLITSNCHFFLKIIRTFKISIATSTRRNIAVKNLTNKWICSKYRIISFF